MTHLLAHAGSILQGSLNLLPPKAATSLSTVKQNSKCKLENGNLHKPHHKFICECQNSHNHISNLNAKIKSQLMKWSTSHHQHNSRDAAVHHRIRSCAKPQMTKFKEWVTNQTVNITDCKAQKPESQICSLTKKHIDIFQVKKHTPTMEIFHIIIQHNHISQIQKYTEK
jgi:hypothetical protein